MNRSVAFLCRPLSTQQHNGTQNSYCGTTCLHVDCCQLWYVKENFTLLLLMFLVDAFCGTDYCRFSNWAVITDVNRQILTGLLYAFLWCIIIYREHAKLYYRL